MPRTGEEVRKLQLARFSLWVIQQSHLLDYLLQQCCNRVRLGGLGRGEFILHVGGL